jgi:superfamily II DNA or RNA helicase
MNQWIERIAEFLPAARVGKIQGPTFDIVEKDIVIGMIQSLYDRTFPTDAFSSFGLTIIDEVHRIGSEEFSKTLFKTITRCMLGISATVERKDGLTCLLYHFIGPKIYSEERKEDTVVEVRAIEFAHPQEEYNVVAYDYKGNVQYSTMVSKISNYVPRSQFLVRIIRDLIRAQPDQQIMVLSHIRALLTFLHDHLLKPVDTNEEGIDVGYYVGGMKKEALEATDKKQVVLATYAMAAEALDIKTLNTLVMVSPKTDIIQSVGRILRMKADGKVIVDIVDTHDVFQNQWKKRRAYYKKCGYGIRYVKSTNYVDMSATHVESWKRVSKPMVNPGDSTSIFPETKEEEEEIEKRVCHIPISEYDFSDQEEEC